MYTLKSIARRGTSLSAAAVLAIAAILPAVIPAGSAYADALNPLTDRSLTLSSSSPGWDYLDASGNSTYAPPNSGANGQKTGNTFAFKVSTDSTASGTNEPIKAMTFQYCDTSAGDCMGPGDIPFTGTQGSFAHESNADALADQKSDLEVVTATPAEVSAIDFGSIINSGTGVPSAIPAADNSQGNFVVMYNNAGTWTRSPGWTMTASIDQDVGGVAGTVADGTSTGKNNFITLANTTGQGFAFNQEVKVIFFGTNTNYITNPGSGEFFVKINTYNSDTTFNDTTIVDGGVTVANVMNYSIEIQTKVLETMQFSVGTIDPFTLEALADAGGGEDQTSELFLANGHTTHGPCERILTGMTPTDPINILQMGNEAAEDSLETDVTYMTHSYWRLSSNSSAGATVYYSGETLSNTVGDQIDAIYRTTPGDGLSAPPQEGMEQFGLALANGDGSDVDAPNGIGYAVDYDVERTTAFPYENAADNSTNGVHASVTADTISNLDENASYHAPQLYPLIPAADYDDGAGTVNADYDPDGAGVEVPQAVDTNFAFDPTSLQIPVPIATENSQVVDCVTGKMRYIANIAATTPAGIYTTNINYIAAPQY